MENLLPLLRSIASKWHSLGEALSLGEDRLDEIFTNNETDEACLRDILEFCDEQSDSQYTWEEIVAVLIKIGQKEIAEKIQGLHVEPCKVVVICTYNCSVMGKCPLLGEHPSPFFWDVNGKRPFLVEPRLRPYSHAWQACTQAKSAH